MSRREPGRDGRGPPPPRSDPRVWMNIGCKAGCPQGVPCLFAWAEGVFFSPDDISRNAGGVSEWFTYTRPIPGGTSPLGGGAERRQPFLDISPREGSELSGDSIRMKHSHCGCIPA